MRTVLFPLVLTAAALTLMPAAKTQPIQDVASTNLPVYIGEPAKAHPLLHPKIPQNPFLAANPFNNVHNDAWMSDVYEIAGPLGRWPAVLSSSLSAARVSNNPFFVCGSLTFDSRGRIVTTCLGPQDASLVLVDPFTLELLAFQHLPVPANPAAGYGSAYMYLDDHDRAVVTLTNQVWIYAETEEPGFVEDPVKIDLSAWVGPNDNIQVVMPDFQGRLWFVVRHSGLVGVYDPAAGTVTGSLTLGEHEEIANSFPMTNDAAYVVSTKALYRLAARGDVVPRIEWRSEYQNSGEQKPGQLSAGSGTSPTILDGGKYVAITDNATQMHVVVYRTALELSPNEKRVVCEVPVFGYGAGATEDSLIGLGRALIVANEYGYDVSQTNKPTVPGIARIDINPNGKGCSLVWTNDQIAAPQVGPKMSSKTALAYFFTRKYDQSVQGFEPYGLDVYYWTAVDFRTGAIVWEQQVGTGYPFDSYVPGPAIGPSGALYVGVHGGLVSLRDTR